MANEDLLLRQMPHSLEGEQAVLGSMLIDADCVKDVMDKLRPSDFYLRQNREIFETIYSMFTYAKPIDGITVCEEMQKAGTYDENTTRSYLAQLMEITPTSANVMEYAAIVRYNGPSRFPNPNRWTPIHGEVTVRWQTKTFSCGRCPTLWRGSKPSWAPCSSTRTASRM